MRTNLKGKASKRILALLMGTFFIAVGIVPAMAGPHGSSSAWQARGMSEKKHHRSALGIWRNPQLVQDLGLTEDQVNKLKDADFASREKRLGLNAQLDTQRLQMDKFFSSDSVDSNAVRQHAKKIADIKGALFVQKVESRLTVDSILSADQVEKLRQLNMKQRNKGFCQGRKSGFGKNRANQPGACLTTSALNE